MMEGDVLLAGVNASSLLMVAGVVLGGVFALLKWFARRLLDDIDKRLARIDELENRFERLMADLPMHYIRRDDHIRDITTLSVKLDRIYELILVRGIKHD